MQKTLTQLIDKKRREIYKDAELENIIIIERHEEAESDVADI